MRPAWQALRTVSIAIVVETKTSRRTWVVGGGDCPTASFDTSAVHLVVSAVVGGMVGGTAMGNMGGVGGGGCGRGGGRVGLGQGGRMDSEREGRSDGRRVVRGGREHRWMGTHATTAMGL